MYILWSAFFCYILCGFVVRCFVRLVPGPHAPRTELDEKARDAACSPVVAIVYWPLVLWVGWRDRND